MIYHCGHRGCDICGSRECAGANLKKYRSDIIACDFCLIKCLRLGIQVSETFSTMIDPDKPCARGKVKITIEEVE